jgi:hypothetical protein
MRIWVIDGAGPHASEMVRGGATSDCTMGPSRRRMVDSRGSGLRRGRVSGPPERDVAQSRHFPFSFFLFFFSFLVSFSQILEFQI